MNTAMQPGSVVVGVDASSFSDAAVEWAVRQAREYRRPLLLVHGAGRPRWDNPEPARAVTDHALEIVRRLDSELVVDVEAPRGDARKALLDHSEQASLVVVGTRGRGAVQALLLGSVSAAVTEHAPCSVAVVRSPVARAADVPGRVVVGVAGVSADTAALELAFNLAATEGNELDAVHVWSAQDTFVDTASYAQRLEQQGEHERRFSEALSGYQGKYPDVTVSRRMPEGGVVSTLVGLSDRASTVVVGSRGHTGLRSVLDSVSRAVVEQANCTVVVARP